ncbi:gamma-soluble NSF attachment protein-like [Nilaparvata lugens]|uniref:gamma-soluble NSF attachment protein-like n=1 Tax=Nilaparvata lugens TaxID=108931 RepID=UPI00193E405E|nr:gamma-soluble NSF attachment protein-like [Nilaparvata lugens]
MLLSAYDEEDPDAARSALNSPFIKHMDVEYSRLARDLPLPPGNSSQPKGQVRQNAAPSYVSTRSQGGGAAAPSGGDEDDFEGGLC